MNGNNRSNRKRVGKSPWIVFWFIFSLVFISLWENVFSKWAMFQ